MYCRCADIQKCKNNLYFLGETIIPAVDNAVASCGESTTHLATSSTSIVDAIITENIDDLASIIREKNNEVDSVIALIRTACDTEVTNLTIELGDLECYDTLYIEKWNGKQQQLIKNNSRRILCHQVLC